MLELHERLSKIPPKGNETIVIGSNSTIASKINNSYDSSKKEAILSALTVAGFEKLVPPTDAELVYVSSVFQSKALTNPDNVTYQLVSDIARSEFSDLNNKLNIRPIIF